MKFDILHQVLSFEFAKDYWPTTDAVRRSRAAENQRSQMIATFWQVWLFFQTFLVNS